MATSSVDLPPQPEEEPTPPAILSGARGLASAIGVAAAAAVVAGRGHGQAFGDGLRKVEVETMRDDCDGEKMEADEMEGVISEPLVKTASAISIATATQSALASESQESAQSPGYAPSPARGSCEGGPVGVEAGGGVFPKETRTDAAPRSHAAHSDNISSPRPSYHHGSTSTIQAQHITAKTPTITHTRSKTNADQIQSGRITKGRHRQTHSISAPASASVATKTLAAAVAAAIASSQVAAVRAAGSTFTTTSTPPQMTDTMTGGLPPEATPIAADIAKLTNKAHTLAAASSPASTTLKYSLTPSSNTVGGVSSSKSSSTSASASASASASSNMTSTATAAPVDKGSPQLSFWGPEPVPLPSRFARIKRNLIRGHEAELEASWTRLLHAIRAEIEHIDSLGAHLIPSIEFADIDNPSQTARFGRDLRRYGVGVLRKVVPKQDADVAVRETIQYLNSKSHIKAQRHDPACFDFFWTPAQVRARAHPSVLTAQRFMMNLWETTPDDRLVTRFPITYVDRLRVHGAGQNKSHDLNVPPLETPQSADDWINALESSAGIFAQVDNGSLERWEPDGYQHAGTYNHVFHGRWEDYDPWECASRTSATMDLYNGYGACTIFRMFQGVLALSTVEPGMVRLLPSPKLATAYYLLRPFFSTRKPIPESRSGPEWEAYLAPENWKLEREPDSIIHGAVPGHAQRITEHWHPHLNLRGSLITLPTLQPGDYIFWHPDLPYYLSSNNYGLKTPSHDSENVSMLVYVPAAPLTQTNALYLARQRNAFQRGHPAPDFDSTGRGTVVEDAETRPGEKEIADFGGPAALQAMGLAPWEVAGTRAGTPPSDRPKSKDEDTEMEPESETKSLTSASSSSHAEAEVVRLANIILFPDRSMLGYSV